MTRSTKYTNLDSLIADTLFKDSDTTNIEILKNFLKYKLDMEDFEISKLTNHLKKFCDSKGNLNSKQLNQAFKPQSDQFYASNPFENNFLTDYKKQNYDPSIHL